MNIQQELINVANSLKIALNKYIPLNNGYLFVGNPSRWPSLAICKQSNNTFNVYKFNSKNDVIKMISKMNNMQLKKIGTEFRFQMEIMNLLNSNYTWYIQKIVNFIEVFVKQSLKTNDLLLIQSKTIEQLIVKQNFKNISINQLYTYMLTKQKFHPKEFIEMFGQVEVEENENSKFKYKKWNIEVIEGAVIEGKAIRDLLDDVEIKLSKIGQQHLAYGNIYFVKTMSGKTLADYMFSSDEIRVRTFKRADEQLIKTMCHELGHRLYSKFIKDKRVVWLKFLDETKKGKSFNDFKVIPGERIKNIRTNKVFTIEADLYTKIQMSMEVDGKKVKYKADKDFVEECEFLDRVVEKKENVWFPTRYSKKDEQEWFSEIFAFYCMGWLKQPAIEWLKEKI